MVQDKILLQINKGNVDDNLKLILNDLSELEMRAVCNLLEHLTETLNGQLIVTLGKLEK